MTTNLDLFAFSNQYCSEPDALSLYCLVDHAGMPGLHKELMRAKIEWRSLFAGTREEGALSVAPLLFNIDPRMQPAQRGVLAWLSEQGTFASALLFVASPLAIDPLASRLALRLDARISEESDVLLRFYDPRIFEQLLNVLSALQVQEFLCCANRWWFAGRTGELHEVGAVFHLIDSFSSPLRLSAVQDFSLLDASECDQVIDQLQTVMPEQYFAIPPSQRYDFVMRQVSAARQLKIIATHELALYCAIALSIGEKFASIPGWDEILCKVSAGEVRFADAVTQIDV